MILQVFQTPVNVGAAAPTVHNPMIRSHKEKPKKSPKNAIYVAAVQSKIGPLFAAATNLGICFVSFHRIREGMRAIRKRHPESHVHSNHPALIRTLKQMIFSLNSRQPQPKFTLHLDGTPFQRAVWKALMKIPAGKTCSYAEIARRIKRLDAVRAVGGACAQNKIALLIPCHRVVQSNGHPGGYAWGLEMKKNLLELEQKK